MATGIIHSASHRLDDGIEQLIVVSDIHGHTHPLQSIDKILAGIDAKTQVIFNGDMFYGGPWPLQVLEWVMTNAGELATMGNHDEATLLCEASIAKKEPPFTEAGTYQLLSEAQIRYIGNRPHRLELKWRGKQIVLMHGHITPDGAHGSWRASPDQQAAVFSSPGSDVCLLGHTHYAFVGRYNGSLLANSGSVSVPIIAVKRSDGLHAQSGRPDLDSSDDNRSSFIRITESNSELSVEVVRFDYDREAALADMVRAGHPEMDRQRRWMASGILEI